MNECSGTCGSAGCSSGCTGSCSSACSSVCSNTCSGAATFKFTNNSFPDMSADNLNKLIDGLEVAYGTSMIVQNAISNGVGGYIVSDTAPDNTNLIWINSADSTAKYYNPDTSTWEYIASVWG